MLLAIDTSSAVASVCVYRGQVLAESSWRAGRSHSAQLLPMTETLLGLAGVDRTDLEGIAVAIGPGSYSGLRVGISTALGLALGLGIGVIQVPTLEGLAWSQQAAGLSREGRMVRAAIEIGRGNYGTASYRLDRGGPICQCEARLADLGTVGALAAEEEAILLLDLDPPARVEAAALWPPGIEAESPASAVRRAAFIAELATLRFHRHDEIADLAVEPVYLG